MLVPFSEVPVDLGQLAVACADSALITFRFYPVGSFFQQHIHSLGFQFGQTIREEEYFLLAGPIGGGRRMGVDPDDFELFAVLEADLWILLWTFASCHHFSVAKTAGQAIGCLSAAAWAVIRRIVCFGEWMEASVLSIKCACERWIREAAITRLTPRP